MLTRRQHIIELIKKNKRTVKELATFFNTELKYIVEDLNHIKKSILPKHRLIINYAVCNSCGFIFKDRESFKTPSKCPKCKRESISEITFRIE